MRLSAVLLALLIAAPVFAEISAPDTDQTPGELCTEDNPDFVEYRYSEQIAYCKRHVTTAMKQEIAKNYGGIPKSEWSNYEFDHLIPLNAGGDSSLANLWPQPIDEAKEKDKLEQEIYNGLKDGTLTQKKAVQMVHDWFDERSKRSH